MKLTNSHCEGIEKSLTHSQHICPQCGLWTIWRSRKTGEYSKDCNCPNEVIEESEIGSGRHEDEKYVWLRGRGIYRGNDDEAEAMVFSAEDLLAQDWEIAE